MKEKLINAKNRYKEKLKADPEKTIAGTVTLVAAIVGLGIKVNDAHVSRSKAKTWKREVERRENLTKEGN